MTVFSRMSKESIPVLAVSQFLPYFAQGRVVKGFGRGSRDLGCPTANFDHDIVEALPAGFPCGVYYGFASLNHGQVHPMVASVGYNPTYGNESKTIETHVMHEFKEDFYGAFLKIVMVGFLREMTSFKDLEQLTEAIATDIRDASARLAQPENEHFTQHAFWKRDASPSPHWNRVRSEKALNESTCSCDVATTTSTPHQRA